MVTKRDKMDMSSIRIFNRMLMLVIILKRIIVDHKWIVNIEGIVIRISIIMVRTGCQYGYLENKDHYCRYDLNLHV